MVRSTNEVNQGTTAGGERIGRGQSPRSSEEAGNDRGAKGGRDVVWSDLEQASQKGPGSAARLCARTRRKTGLECSRSVHSGPPAKQVSEAKAYAAGATPPKPGVECLSQSIAPPRTGKPDALCGLQNYVASRGQRYCFDQTPTGERHITLSLILVEPPQNRRSDSVRNVI